MDVLLGCWLSSVGLVCQGNFRPKRCRCEPTPQSAFVDTSSSASAWCIPGFTLADGRSARGGVLMRAQRLRLTLRPLDMKRFIGVSQLSTFLLYFPLVQRSETPCALINVQLLREPSSPTDGHPGPFSQARFSAQRQRDNLILQQERLLWDVPFPESACLSAHKYKNKLLLRITPAERSREYVLLSFQEHQTCECRVERAGLVGISLMSRVQHRVAASVLCVTGTIRASSRRYAPKTRLKRWKRMKDEGRIRAMAKFKHKRMKSKPESERDSGFSDGSSEHLSAIDQTDTEDSSCSRWVGGALQGLSPMIIMNNVVLNQSGENAPSLKPWAFSPAVEVVQQPQVVFLQPVVPQRSATVPKGHASKRRRHKKYLPILKSYPKIAPHPGDNPHKSSSSSASSVKSSSSCHTDRGQSSSSPLPVSLPASALPHDTSADSDSTRPESTDGRSSSNSCNTDNKIKRFCNTYNILSKSGLLDITLRTKELLRQNRRTQTELERLREHTNMFMEALQTGDCGIWSKLQMSMNEEDKGKERRPRDEENRDVTL
ncbi:CLOCK-interacting pacemaker [Anabarilius grahami]|uniref:CLOCK-interacting pacemaker n=1 Tax=Anabarilius grahami TaxID=495550 RepID=A0A3N0YWD3_ANAGA|nr:CLOCK-interacting pacemaker [Anabarilius grahami]